MNEEKFVAALRTALAERDNWTEQAHCHGLWEVFDMDYDQEDKKVSYVDTLPLMRKICGNCPVREQCLTDSLLYSDEFGFRGGHTAAERIHIRRRTEGIVTWEGKQKMLRNH